MLRPCIDFEVLELLARKRAPREHALHGLLQNALGMLAVENLVSGAALDAPRIARVPEILLVETLVAGEDDIARVDDDDIVAVVHVRGVAGLVLAAQPRRDERRKPADHEAVGIDENPGLLDVLGCGGVGFHDWHHFRSSKDRRF